MKPTEILELFEKCGAYQATAHEVIDGKKVRSYYVNPDEVLAFAAALLKQERDGQEAVCEIGADGPKWNFTNPIDNLPIGVSIGDKLFTRPPITSQREIELLAEIEKLSHQIVALSATERRDTY